MKNKTFILNIINLYQDARVSKFKSRIIRRGRSRSISSDTEDLFALFLSKNITCDLIYIDQPISFNDKPVQFYPDIVIVKNDKIKSFCDLKMDLGWNRYGLYSFCEKHKDYLIKIKNKTCKIRDGITKEDKYYTVSKSVSYNVVIMSNQNINPKKIQEHQKNIKKLGRDVELFILSQKKHPNTYGYKPTELIKKIEINDSEFAKLIKKLNK